MTPATAGLVRFRLEDRMPFTYSEPRGKTVEVIFRYGTLQLCSGLLPLGGRVAM